MSEAKRILAASKKVFLARQEERAFGTTSEDVRAWEPEPTLELAAAFRPKTVPSMYETARGIADGTLTSSGEPKDTYWNRSN